jgi:hypothetical protein
LGLIVLTGGVTFFITEFWLAFPVFFAGSVLMAARTSPFQALLRRSSQAVGAAR